MSEEAGGHVFVVRGDLTHFACDALLIPSKGMGDRPGDKWVHAVDLLGDAEAGLDRGGQRTAVLKSVRGADGPVPILTMLAGHTATEMDWYLDGVRQFLACAMDATEAKRFLKWRVRRLFAVNFVGTGRGGAQRRAGDVATALMPFLNAEAARLGVDIAVVESNEAKYSALQAARRGLGVDQAWGALSPQLKEQAGRIGLEAAEGKVVPFLGAGVGIGVGFPSWTGLLMEIAQANGMDAKRLELLKGRSAQEVAEYLSALTRRAGGDINEWVAKRMSPEYALYGLQHALLVSLGAREAITTNYDKLFEFAARSVQAEDARDTEIAVLPFANPMGFRRWILKIHGCVSDPKSIVLTRRQYFETNRKHAALFGVLQSMLITKRLLFVGFSLTDADFIEVLEEVRMALVGSSARPEEGRRFGTALMLRDNEFDRGVWDDSLEMVPMVSSHQGDQDGARMLEIFLDYAAASASDRGHHLLDPTFEGVRSEAETALRGEFLDFLKRARAVSDLSELAAWRRIESLAKDLGYEPGPHERR